MEGVEFLINKGDYKYGVVKNVVYDMFSSLNITDIELLTKYTADYINFLTIKFNIDLSDATQSSEIWNQYTKKNMHDIKFIILLLLPFIDDNSGEKKKQLKNLSDLYTEKDASGKYKYTNSQYNRCIRVHDKNNPRYASIQDKFILKDSEENCIERPYCIEYLENNFLLLLMSTDIISNKLYVNWTNIVPIRMDEFKDTYIYKKTLEKFKMIGEKKILIDRVDRNPGLSLNDIYNTIAHHLFYGFREQKWMLYDIVENGELITYIEYIESRIDLKDVYDGITWDNNKNKKKFTSQWYSFFRDGKQNSRTIVGVFYVFFCRFHVNANALVKDGSLKMIEMKNVSITFMDEDDLKISRYNGAMSGMTKVDVSEIYLFLLNQVNKLKKSWYYYYYKKKQMKKKTKHLDSITHPKYGKIPITLKNLFNLCQSLCSIQLILEGSGTDEHNYPELPLYWHMLPLSSIDEIIKRLSKPSHVRIWFVINNYFRRFHPKISEDDYREITVMIYKKIMEKIIKIVFQTLILNGTLSRFIPNRDVLWLSRENAPLYKDNSYYFLTLESYGKLNEYNTFSKDRKTKDTYFNYLINYPSDSSWMAIYPMQWMSQINFFHKYINTRVMYITGAPGIGKSSQIPKLVMYAQRIVEYNNSGKTVCTVPRISVLEKASVSMSADLGVPINDGATVDNFYIQTKHANDSHISDTYPSFIKFITDGSLLNEIKNYPFLTYEKESKQFVDDNGNNLDWIKKYSSKNVYDTIIIDEAHEHNSNMDLIITLMRDALYVNNSIKLIIMSATMDDDEPIYRRYFRDINDNRAYPLCSTISSGMILDKNMILLDRCNIDRRIHVSPPEGIQTRFKIIDHYLTPEQSSKIDSTNYVSKSIEMTLDILKKSNSEHVLVFMPTVSDINETIKGINEKTEGHIIALPYHKNITDEMNELIKNIHIELKNLTKDKKTILEDSAPLNAVKKNTYSRAVIVASTIAEASLTIQNLGFVVDSGLANTKLYNPVSDLSETVIIPISNTSSAQRRGRLGRIASGEFYPLYDEKKLASNKTRYKISDEDCSETVSDLLKKKTNDFSIVFEYGTENGEHITNNINSIGLLNQFLSEGTVRRRNILDAYLTFAEPIKDIIVNNYCIIRSEFIDDLVMIYKYFGKVSNGGLISNFNSISEYAKHNHDDYGEYIIYNEYFSRCYTGFDFNTLDDPYCKFYVIHPDENAIIRDDYLGKFDRFNDKNKLDEDYMVEIFSVNGEIYNKNPNTLKNFVTKMRKRSYLHLPKTSFIRERGLSKMIFVNVPSHSVGYNIRYKHQTRVNDSLEKMGEVIKLYYTENILIKTDLYNQVINLGNILSITAPFNRILWYAYVLARDNFGELSESVIAIINMLEFDNLESWIIKDNQLVQNIVNIYQNQYGDIMFFYEIWKKLKEQLISQGIKIELDINAIEREFNVKKISMTSLKKDDPDLIVLNQLSKSGKLNGVHGFYYFMKKKNLSKGYEIDENVLKKFAENYYLKYATLQKFLKNFATMKFNVDKNRWMYNYELAHNLRTISDNEINLLLEKFNFSKIMNNTLIEAYLRSHTFNLCQFENDIYKNIIINGKIASVRLYNSQYRRTFADASSGFVIFDKTSTQKVSGINLLSYDYITAVNLTTLIMLNPYFFFYYIKSQKNKNKPVNENILNEYNDYYLESFVQELGDPQIYESVASEKNEI